jgi:FkbM family methyltransferase
MTATDRPGSLQPVTRTPPLAAQLARALTALIRVKTLPVARWALSGLPSPYLVSRRFMGYRLVVDVSRTDTHRLLFVVGERFLIERRLVASLVERNSTIVEVGANIGYFTLLYKAASGGTARIRCLEPEPSNLEELRRNIEINRLEGVTVQPVAASDVDAPLTLRSGINGVVGQGGDLRVQAHRLDTLITGPVDLVKIDVEGHEAHVLRGATGLMARRAPTILVEVHPDLVHPPYRTLDVLELLRRHYPRVTAHVPRLTGPLGQRLAARYLPDAAVAHHLDDTAVESLCRDGIQRDPFWLVARRP